jgi:hypothetical protein
MKSPSLFSFVGRIFRKVLEKQNPVSKKVFLSFIAVSLFFFAATNSNTSQFLQTTFSGNVEKAYAQEYGYGYSYIYFSDVPSSLTVQAGSPSGVTVYYVKPTATLYYDGQYAGQPSVSCIPASGSFFPVGSNLVTCSAYNMFTAEYEEVSFRVNVLYSDQTAPVITLSGSSAITVAAGSVYTDAGATATDNIDGNITARISVTGAVNTATPGVYVLTYRVSDNAGNAATPVTRTITVTDQGAPVITLSGSSAITVAAGSV